MTFREISRLIWHADIPNAIDLVKVARFLLDNVVKNDRVFVSQKDWWCHYEYFSIMTRLYPKDCNF